MNFDEKTAKELMQKLSETLDEIPERASIVLSIGENTFFVENDLMEDATREQKDTVLTGANIALVNGLFDLDV